MKRSPSVTDPRCPECGASVHLNSASCGSCGVRRGEHGWFGAVSHDGLGLGEADDDFDYEAFVEEEFGEAAGDDRPLVFLHRMTTRQRFWWLVAVVTLLAFGWLVIRGSFW